jgi:hypothetical protein
MSTWRTDADDFDVLTDLPTRDGRRLRYDELIGRAPVQDIHGVAVHVAALLDVITSKEWAGPPKDRQALPEREAGFPAPRRAALLRAGVPGWDEPEADEQPRSSPR